MTDYSKWDSMARDEDALEAREKEEKRNSNRERYFREQQEKKEKFQREQAGKKSAGHSHGAGSHGHSHGGEDAASGMQPLLEQPRRPACGCGYADVDEMKRAAAEAAAMPQLTAEEKLSRKRSAVDATREHGKQLFAAGQFEQAFAVYERGVLIVSGMFGVGEAEQAQLTELEVILDLNMAACKLKLKQWKEAIEQCRMALQLEPTSIKAHFRWGSALVGLGEYAEAREKFQRATELDATGACKKEVAQQLAEIKRLETQERLKVAEFSRQMEAKMAQQAGREKLQEEAKEQDAQATHETVDRVSASMEELRT